MRPVKPILPGASLPVTVFAANQPEYQQLPAYVFPEDGCVLSRWKMTWRERIVALLMGDVYLYQHTFNAPLQPVWLQVEAPKILEGEL